MKTLYKAFLLALFLFANTAATPSTINYEVRNILHDDFRNTPKILFNQRFRPQKVGITSIQLAKEYIQKHAKSQFGVQPNDLVFIKTKKSLLGDHIYFRQMLAGYEVLKGEVIVSIDSRKGEVVQVFNSTFPVSEKERRRFAKNLRPKKTISKKRAYDIVWNDLGVRGKILEKPSIKKAFVGTKKGFLISYEVKIAVEKPFGYWQYTLNAVDGKIMVRKDRRQSRKPTFFPKFGRTKRADIWSREKEFKRFLESEKKMRSFSEMQRADGQAIVFDPDPRTALMNYALQDDSDASAFEAAYQPVTLKDISFDGGKYVLSGPWVTIADFESPRTAPSQKSNGQWSEKRGNNSFNDVMTYYHLDKNQRYMQSLGFKGERAIQSVSIEVDTNGVNGNDNSHYIPSTNRMAFGHGCVDDNEDADVILHEYGHAINYSINESWSGGDTGAMGEGFGDYWAGSYSISTENGSRFRVNEVFTWDGHGDGADCWPGRRMDRMNVKYDHSRRYPPHSPIENGAQSDELWATPLFQALLTLIEQGYTREQVDSIILEAQFGLGADLKMRDMANAIVQTARRLYPAGNHADVFIKNFVRHDIIQLPSAKFEVESIQLANTGGNDNLDPGETPSMTVQIKNVGTHDANQIVAEVTSDSDIRILQGQTAFPATDMGAVTQNSSKLKFKINDEFECGKTVDLNLKLAFNGGAIGEQDIPITLGTGDPQKVMVEDNISGGIGIPDANDTGIKRRLTLPSGGEVKSIKVGMNVEHPFIGDLKIKLISPSGTTVALHSREGSSRDNIVGVYPDTLTPSQSLSAFNGEDIGGEWTLSVVDGVGSDAGKLKGWSLELVAGYVCE